MQFIRVTFPDPRTVFIDGGATGCTGDTLTIDEGPHDVDLGTPLNYTPTEQPINPFGTSLEKPELVPFDLSLSVFPPTTCAGASAGEALADGRVGRAPRTRPSGPTVQAPKRARTGPKNRKTRKAPRPRSKAGPARRGKRPWPKKT
jgi:hypothetical protein